MRDVLRRISVGAKFKSLVSRRRENSLVGRDPFPLGEGGEVRPFILTHKLDRERAAAIKSYGRAHGATVNDVVLTAFYRRLFKRLALRHRAELCVPLMVDMRRYLEKTGKFDALTNLTSMTATRLEHRSEEPFAGTLTRVKTIMDAQKKDHIGLHEFVKADLVFRALGDRMANRLLRWKLKTPLICMTNIGILDSARLSFGGLRPQDAFLCGSIKYKPYFQLAASTYEGEITLSANLRGADDDRARIVSLFEEIDAELPGG